jgi:hypothetical protein
MGSDTTKNNIKHTTQTLNALPSEDMATENRIDYAAAHVMTILREYNEIKATI